MSLEHISQQLAASEATGKKKLPPVELWDPPYCGEIDIQIKTDGSWFYNGGIFKRINLVKLFASVLKKEQGEYFLVTPVEKVKIAVEDAPFVLTQWQWQDGSQQAMVVSTNVDDEFILDKNHPLIISEVGDLYITVRRNLVAKVHRNVYYQWVELASEVITKRGKELVFTSSDHSFSLGKL
ncbi:hypothetical protein CJF42_21705 [Pseudoalteromonas sp. NBT06-2]|uniref:DUF1285 domain-containing protein n=1 Tax=Pseudoalteromonas sp. NBT06-2 TaxID=2025950 RepID=UPI000BA62D16|nr:DUF1285 domain-containing protein [Pseudoalteromonas sp. NBT06-2]PAJ72357.1 hypothetical protein CJF42_21705 [Pseudoalteromonas sp. NBT06-2]